MTDQLGPVEEPEHKIDSPPSAGSVVDQQPKPQQSQEPHQAQQQQVAPAFSPPEFLKPLPDCMKRFRQAVNDGTAATKPPRGLEPLSTARQLVVKHDSEMIETKCKCYKNCHYEIYNERHQLIYYAAEDINVFSLCCLTKYRPFRMLIYDQLQYNCVVFKGFISFCHQKCTVEVPAKQLKATIKKVTGEERGKPYFHVLDEKGEIAFKIVPVPEEKIGKFDIFGSDQQTKVGELSNQWSGFFREAFADKDSFGVSLPVDMDVTWKAVLMGCLFFIDYLIYESK